MFIYKITNTKNGMAYVGSTCRPIRQRMSNHWSDARRGKDSLIAQAIRDFGQESFSVEIIGEAKSSDEMIVMEVEAIRNLNTCHPNGYNSSAGAGLWVADRRHLESVREKISEAHKGKKLSEEHRLKLSESLKGRPSWNAGIKTGKPSWNRGIPATPEHREKLIASHAGKLIHNVRSIEFLGVVYPSIAEAGRATGFSRMQMKYRLATGNARYVDAPNGGYQDPKLPERRKTACPKCGGPYSEFKSGLRYCSTCRRAKMMVAQRIRRAAKKNSQPEPSSPTGVPLGTNNQKDET